MSQQQMTDIDYWLSQIGMKVNAQTAVQGADVDVLRQLTGRIDQIVPTLCMQTSIAVDGGHMIPADVYYLPIGAASGTTEIPAWAPAVTQSNWLQWDATDKRFYVRFATAGVAGQAIGAARMMFPLGPFGDATAWAPKNLDAHTAVFRFRGRFNDNADYTDSGVGATSTTTAANQFVAGSHFIQVTRNGASWELGTGDGTAVTQTAGGTADASLHNFEVRWTEADVTLYVDSVLTVTQTANLPTQPLALCLRSASSATDIDVVDLHVSWLNPND